MLPIKHDPNKYAFWDYLSRFIPYYAKMQALLKKQEKLNVLIFVLLFVMFCIMLFMLWFILKPNPVQPTFVPISNKSTVALPQQNLEELFPSKVKVAKVSATSENEDFMEFIADRNDVYDGFSTYDKNGLPMGRKWLYAYEFRGKHLDKLSEQQKAGFKQWKEAHIKNFIEQSQLFAAEVAKKYSIPEEVIVAQAIMESAYGTSRLAVTATNYFGHKWRPHNRGEKGIVGFVNAHDDGPNDVFAQYETGWFAFNKHGKILKEYLDRSNSKTFPDCLCEHRTIKYATSCSSGRYVANVKAAILSLKKRGF